MRARASWLDIRWFAAVLGSCGLFACAQQPVRHGAQPGVLAVIDDIADAEGNRVLIIRDYVDELKIDGRDVRQRFQYVWNYTRGIAQMRVLDVDGGLLRTLDQPRLTLNVTEAEREYAFDRVRADPRWTAMHRVDSMFYGGFSFRPPQHAVCSERARCIHVFASDSGGRNTTLHVIYDLMSDYSELAAERADSVALDPPHPSLESSPR
jgi:hypothetical protein